MESSSFVIVCIPSVSPLSPPSLQSLRKYFQCLFSSTDAVFSSPCALWLGNRSTHKAQHHWQWLNETHTGWEPASSSSSSSHEFCTRDDDTEGWVGGIRGCLQPITGQQHHTLPLALHRVCKHLSPSLLSSTLSLCVVSTATDWDSARARKEQHVRSGSREAGKQRCVGKGDVAPPKWMDTISNWGLVPIGQESDEFSTCTVGRTLHTAVSSGEQS